MKSTTNSDNRFDSDAGRYAAYLETPEGRLRAELTSANLLDMLHATAVTRPLRALDLGCGTGTASVCLARLGIEATLLDSSPAMLSLAERTAIEAGLSDKITVKKGDAAHLSDIFQTESFDIILCHNLLEYVEDPNTVLRSVARLMQHPLAVLSILVRNQAGEVLKAALQNGDLAGAENNLDTKWAQESLYGGKVRLFTPDALEAMLQDASLVTTARRGVRILSDYLPSKISRSIEYERIFALERKLGERWEFFAVARYLQCFATCSASVAER